MPLIEQVLDKNPDTVKVVFKNMPLNFHKFADPSARAALAAARQGRFWEYHDRLFAADKLSSELFEDIAASLELDLEQFNADMNSTEVREQINRDLLAARQAGVTGTPTIFINGKKLRNRSLQGFQAAIDQEMRN